jgi:alanine racemase
MLLPSSYTIAWLNKTVNGTLLTAQTTLEIEELIIDSRKPVSTPNAVFFALVTQKNDGHRYLEEMYKKGVHAFVVSKQPQDLEIFPFATFILVSDTLVALQTFAIKHRELFSLPIIGITGSNGKTIVKEWLFQLLNGQFNIIRSPKSYNSQIGVPLSVLQISKEHTLGIFEAGISQPNEIENLRKIIDPDYGILTNIGPAHDENFLNWEEKLREKLKFFKSSKFLIFNGDIVLIDQLTREIYGNNTPVLISWGYHPNNAIHITSLLSDHHNTVIEVEYRSVTSRISIPFTDKASIENAMHCWALMLCLQTDKDSISELMPKLTPVEMRMELKEGINNCSIINDIYNSDFHSLSIALDFLCQQQQHPRRTIILSDILQSGKTSVQLYTEVAALLEAKGINKLIGIGADLLQHQSLFEVEKHFFPSTEEFLTQFDFTTLHNETILLKGARKFEFEKILERLQQKAHETVLEINLDALIQNLNFYRNSIKPKTKLMAMVKAFSYGSGGFEIANILQYHRVDYLTVAYADEGIELRKAGISMPIMVMNPEEQGMDGMIRYRLEPEIYNFRVLGMLENALLSHTENLKEPFSVHIKFDTGMHRLGFEPEDMDLLIQRLNNNKTIKVISAFSHLVGSDTPALDAFTHEQIDRFEKMGNKLRKGIGYSFIRHILNSGGIRRFPDAQFEMVRLGISLYGIAANEEEQPFLENVSTLKTVISQIRNIKKGDTIGYGRAYTANTDMRIAVIPIGYADGLNRKLSNGVGRVLINHSEAPIVGTICMDMCMIDITHIRASEGDSVIIFGKDLPIQKLAGWLDTIPYEVLTGISRRVKRIYFQE